MNACMHFAGLCHKLIVNSGHIIVDLYSILQALSFLPALAYLTAGKCVAFTSPHLAFLPACLQASVCPVVRSWCWLRPTSCPGAATSSWTFPTWWRRHAPYTQGSHASLLTP